MPLLKLSKKKQYENIYPTLMHSKKLTRDLLPLQLRFRFSLILLDLSFIILVEYPYPSV